MAKVLWREDEEQFDKTHPGCISGLFNVLDYQLWHSNVKKILPNRNHDSLIEHAKRNRRYKRVSDDQDPFEVLELLDAQTSHILVDQSNKKTSSTKKRSLKAHFKSLVSEDTYKENNNKGPRLQRTYSIHHLESNQWVHPIIYFPENVNNEDLNENSKRDSNDTHPEINDSRDILEMFKVDNETFVNVLQDGSQISNTNPKLTKSGSFPTSFKPGSRNLMPMKLKDKLNEFYTISKSEKMLETPRLKLVSSNSVKNLYYDLNGNNVMRLRRVSSLNESADRYSKLLDFSVTKEATLRPSRSLKLTNGNENLLSAQEPFFRTNQESRDTCFSESSSQNERIPVSTQDHECLGEVVDKSDDFSENQHSVLPFGEDTNGPTREEVNHQISLDEKVQSESQISEGNQENLDKEIKTLDDDDYTYVKQILERSGFMKNGFEQTWYSSNQPLDHFVFQEIESQYFHDTERFEDEMKELSRRLLIFDLVDDVLLTMYEQSLTYYPKPLSSSCHIRPSTIEPRVLDEVWKRVSRLINLKPDTNQSLNDIVSRDLGSNDGWMNLQLDSECVAFDLEDLILDEVLEEMLFEFI